MGLFGKKFFASEDESDEGFPHGSLNCCVMNWVDEQGDDDAVRRAAERGEVLIVHEAERKEVEEGTRPLDPEELVDRILEELDDEYGWDEGHQDMDPHDRKYAVKLADDLCRHIGAAYVPCHLDEVGRHEVDLKGWLEKNLPEVLNKPEAEKEVTA